MKKKRKKDNNVRKESGVVCECLCYLETRRKDHFFVQKLYFVPPLISTAPKIYSVSNCMSL